MGKVFLVGAGPGDPDLLTMKAVRLLKSADVVLHDALVSPEILGLIRPGASVIDIGKRCGRKLLTQDEINSLLVHHAQQATMVIRLKGGDPTVFGRAGEEISALMEAGADFEIVPGITTALAAAASARVSLTDRRFASSLTLMTAHRGSGPEAVEWNRLVTSGSTIAIYMPGSDYGALEVQLRGAGLAGNTPCVVVSHASLSTEQWIFTRLEKLGNCPVLPAPSFLIVGRCVQSVGSADEAANLLLTPTTSTNFVSSEEVS